jgi:3'-5' exonuclease
MNERFEPPTREEVAELPSFTHLRTTEITVVADEAQAADALALLSKQEVLGFDTESKPTFKANQKSAGPHVVQFSTSTAAFVFQLRDPACLEAVRSILESSSVVKVGFGLASDRKQLLAKFKIRPNVLVDLDNIFRDIGYRKQLGVKGAVAVILQTRFSKSKKLTTSDWSAKQLSPGQVLYAGNDAYAAVCVYNELSHRGQIPFLGDLAEPPKPPKVFKGPPPAPIVKAGKSPRPRPSVPKPLRRPHGPRPHGNKRDDD